MLEWRNTKPVFVIHRYVCASLWGSLIKHIYCGRCWLLWQLIEALLYFASDSGLERRSSLVTKSWVQHWGDWTTFTWMKLIESPGLQEVISPLLICRSQNEGQGSHRLFHCHQEIHLKFIDNIKSKDQPVLWPAFHFLLSLFPFLPLLTCLFLLFLTLCLLSLLLPLTPFFLPPQLPPPATEAQKSVIVEHLQALRCRHNKPNPPCRARGTMSERAN